MSKIQVGTINELDLLKKVRRQFPRQTERVQSTAKGKRGYNRQRDKRAFARSQD